MRGRGGFGHYLIEGVSMFSPSSNYVGRSSDFFRAAAILALLLPAIFLLSGTTQATEVTLAWDANHEPDLAGYRLYCGKAPREYNFFVDVGSTPSATLTDLQDGNTYYVAVTAYDAAGDESDYSNEVTVNLLPLKPKTILAINCGGLQYTDREGNVYRADRLYVGGSTYSTKALIDGTEDDPIYQSERFGDFSYRVPLQNGNYSVTLKFAEIYYSWAGARIFDVQIQGIKVLKNVDLIALSGKKNKGYDVIFPAKVTNGLLTIDLLKIQDNAKINAILIKEN